MSDTTFTVQGTDVGGYVADVVPIAAAKLASGQLTSKADLEAELDLMLAELRESWQLEPDQVMRLCAAFSSRLTELYVHLHRLEGRMREWRQVRTQQVVPMLQEIDRQYKLASRMVEVRRQDIDLMR